MARILRKYRWAIHVHVRVQTGPQAEIRTYMFEPEGAPSMTLQEAWQFTLLRVLPSNVLGANPDIVGLTLIRLDTSFNPNIGINNAASKDKLIL